MIRNIVNKLVTILTNSGDFTTVRDDFPDDAFLPVDLPAVIVYHGPAEYRETNWGTYFVRRKFFIEIYHSVATNRENITQREDVETIMQDTIKLLFQKRTLEGLAKVDRAYITEDSGVAYGGYGRDTFVGIQIILEVEYEENVT